MSLISKHLWTIWYIPPSQSSLGCQLGTRPIPSGLEVCKTWSLPYSPLDHTDFCPFFFFFSLNIPLREELEQLLTHRSPTATWQHPSQVFLPQSEAKENPQRKPSGSFCVRTHPRHPGTHVFHRQPQSTQLASPGLLATYSTSTGWPQLKSAKNLTCEVEIHCQYLFTMSKAGRWLN